MRIKKYRITLWIALVITLSFLSFAATEKAAPAQRPIELQDILEWKAIRSNTLSNNGEWFAFQHSPTEGDSEMVLRSTTQTEKEFRFSIGEAARGRGRPRPGQPARAATVAFSEDSEWLAFFVYPTREEAKKLRKAKKPVQNQVALVKVATGEKTEFEKVRKFAFSGEDATHIALQKYGTAGSAQAAAGPPRGAAGSSSDRPSGSDLILRELDTGIELNLGNVSSFAFDKKGEWMAWTIDAAEKSGNGVVLRNIKTGAVMPLDSDKAIYKQLRWTEKGDALAVLKGKEDEGYENELYSLLGFKNLADGAPDMIAFDPTADRDFPSEMTISPNRAPVWTESMDAIFFGIHELEKKKEKKRDQGGAGSPRAGRGEGSPSKTRPEGQDSKAEDADEEEKPDLVLWHWMDNRLQSQQQVEESRDKNFNYVCIYRVAEKKFLRLADDSMRRVTFAPEHGVAIGFDNREYELMGNLDGRRYQDIYVVDLTTGKRNLAVKKSRWYTGPSPKAEYFLHYEDGHYFVYDTAALESRNITKDVSTSFINEEDDHNVVKPPIRALGWVKGGKSVLLSDNWDFWQVSVDGGPGVNLTVNGKKDKIRYRSRFVLDREEKGIDLSDAVYFNALAEWTKKGGIARLDNGNPGVKMLLWEDAVFSNLTKAENADVFLYTQQTYEKYPDYYVTARDLAGGRKITEANPQQKDFLWSSGSKLIDFESDKGDRLQASLFLPANYEEGKSYPMVVQIYEKLTARFNSYYSPSANGFNKSVYTSNGYAVLMPDIVYRVNDPGMSAVWCVVPAVKAAIETGIVDAEKVAIHGHSWGGYQTSFLVTQTDVFAAAIAGAPLTNMISMYSSVYWNTGSANIPIFESSQGRFTGGPWEIFEAYERNSPVHFAANIKTPLMILHNDKDGAVDFNQGITFFNTIRRMRKPVIMLQYTGENHGLRKPANQKDYTVRMKEFLDHHLQGKRAPEWLTKGVSHLKLDEELKQRTKTKISSN